MNNFSNCWRFYFSVFLENGKIVVRGTDSKKLGIGTKWRYQKMVCFSFSHTSEEYKMLWWTSVSSSLRLEKSLCLYVLSYYLDDFLA